MMNTEITPNNKVKMVAGYALQQRLGSGSFATVYKGVSVEDSTDVVAIKAIGRTSEKLTKKVLENLEMEISILRTYRHPNIVSLNQVQKTERHFYLILEYCSGGDVQRLIRSRKSGRLSERLTRRLLRDLASGLQFLWGQELIHRDIKPQNLLLTGPLPLDELNDPAKSPELEEARIKANFPSLQFALKIADFGFARHLQTASLAETLCGSPLYMAPEILQHHRYDAKADLWSVGTVLFEMISGRPPFTGENHLDLLRNIQRKAVRLPPNVRVSKECVTLLRLLLNRNPLSRAGFSEFFQASQAFCALGCEGEAPAAVASTTTTGPLTTNTRTTMDLGTIHEVEGNGGGGASMVTVQTEQESSKPSKQGPPPAVTPPLTFTPSSPPPAIMPSMPPQAQAEMTRALARPGFAPLEPSPPSDIIQNYRPDPRFTARPPFLPSAQPPFATQTQLEPYTNTIVNESSQHDSEESEFVMVEHSKSDSPSTSVVRATAAAASRYGAATTTTRGDSYLVVHEQHRHGILSTSPNTGGALMGNTTTCAVPTTDAEKLISTAEDVGRRAVSVAHLGDSRAYLAMRALEEQGSILLNTTMEEEEEEEDSAAVTDDEDEDTPVAGTTQRRNSISSTSMADVKEEDEDEMPFAITTPTAVPKAVIPNITKTTTTAKPTQKALALFGEALSCYLKALSMLKGSISAVNQISGSNKRLEVTAKWLSGQFAGVLERADAANVEIGKLQQTCDLDRNDAFKVTVEELIYNHALQCGRDGAVKQLLGQYEAARSSYRSAGLLAEALLMEPKLGREDRTILESYVDGFAARITELDQAKSSVIGLIGPATAV